MVPVDKKTYGNFHTGDSYIVLHVSHRMHELVLW